MYSIHDLAVDSSIELAPHCGANCIKKIFFKKEGKQVKEYILYLKGALGHQK